MSTTRSSAKRKRQTRSGSNNNNNNSATNEEQPLASSSSVASLLTPSEIEGTTTTVTEMDDKSATENVTRFCGWIDNEADDSSTSSPISSIRKRNGRIYHDGFVISIGNPTKKNQQEKASEDDSKNTANNDDNHPETVLEISVGDAVLLRSSKTTATTVATITSTTGDESSRITRNDMEDTIDYYGIASMTAGDSEYDQSAIARVESIWEEENASRQQSGEEGEVANSPRKIQFLARWFLKRKQMESIRNSYSGVESPDDFISGLSDRDLILGDQTDVNPITAICGTILVVYRRPDSDQQESLPISSMASSNIYICRHRAQINDEAGTVEVVSYSGKNDKWPDFLSGRWTPDRDGKARGGNSLSENEDDEKGGIADKRFGATTTSTTPRVKPSNETKERRKLNENSFYSAASTASSSDGDAALAPPKQRTTTTRGSAGLDEGTTEKRDIRVGAEHQAVVPAFVPNQESVSRGPISVWKPGAISEDEMNEFLSSAAEILSGFLRSNKFTHDEPYSPLPWDKMEALHQSLGIAAMPSLSSVCTAASLCGSRRRVDMLRECDADSILSLLNKKNYDTKECLAAIAANPRDYLTIWTIQEKELFNSGFRRYSGSLRMIYKGIAPSKDFKEVIDYHYRFKIPDQFRCFQDTKREQAVRMMECIETRRNISAGIQNSTVGSAGGEPATKKRQAENEWSKTSVADVAGAVEERRVKAKKLLLDIEAGMGKEKLGEVVDVIKRFNQRSVFDLKAEVVEICTGYPEFEQRLLEFLPKRYS